MRIRKPIVAIGAALALTLGGTTACADKSEPTHDVKVVPEDCEVSEQKQRDRDCGYWQKNGEIRQGDQPDITWLWIWFTWVQLGKYSKPPAHWSPPKGVKIETRTIQVPRQKNCALGPAPAPPRPAAPAPARPAPPAGNKAPANKPPAQKAGC